MLAPSFQGGVLYSVFASVWERLGQERVLHGMGGAESVGPLGSSDEEKHHHYRYMVAELGSQVHGS